MLKIVPERPMEGPAAQKLAQALEEDGCDVELDEGYGNPIHIRGQSGYKFVVFLWEKDYHSGIITLHNRWDDEYTNISRNKFIKNWRSYLEE